MATTPQQYRERRKWTREQLAVRAGVTSRTVAHIESGRACTTTVLVKVAHALGLSRGEFFKAWNAVHSRAAAK